MGTLAGIARHARPKGPMEAIAWARVTCEAGVEGDHRGALRSGPYNRQVTLIERSDWEAAIAEVGREVDWRERRANLLVSGIDLPQLPGARLRIGSELVVEITCECDPCERMEALAPGLRAALTPDWRGGACALVVTEGEIAIGDVVEIED